MRPPNLIVMMTACASLTCGGQTNAPSSTTLTAADVHAFARRPEKVYIAPARPIDRNVPIAQWRARYPDSARVLDEWTATNARTASRLIAWGVREPEKLEVLVLWSVTNPFEPIGVFLIERPSWEELGAIAQGDPEGLAAFLDWARRSQGAAEELAVHPGGLGFVESLR